MSKLASKIQTTPAPDAKPVKRGPDNCCFPLYGAGDLEDAQAVDALRVGRTWRQVQEHVDKLVGIERHLPLDKFRYHWRRMCYCWPEDLRR